LGFPTVLIVWVKVITFIASYWVAALPVSLAVALLLLAASLRWTKGLLRGLLLVRLLVGYRLLVVFMVRLVLGLLRWVGLAVAVLAMGLLLPVRLRLLFCTRLFLLLG
jgi:hypothetical protein